MFENDPPPPGWTDRASCHFSFDFGFCRPRNISPIEYSYLLVHNSKHTFQDLTMKISMIAAAALAAIPANAEVFLKEQFNDKVRYALQSLHC
jgi:hypothetical protein